MPSSDFAAAAGTFATAAGAFATAGDFATAAGTFATAAGTFATAAGSFALVTNQQQAPSPPQQAHSFRNPVTDPGSPVGSEHTSFRNPVTDPGSPVGSEGTQRPSSQESTVPRWARTSQLASSRQQAGPRASETGALPAAQSVHSEPAKEAPGPTSKAATAPQTLQPKQPVQDTGAAPLPPIFRSSSPESETQTSAPTSTSRAKWFSSEKEDPTTSPVLLAVNTARVAVATADTAHRRLDRLRNAFEAAGFDYSSSSD